MFSFFLNHQLPCFALEVLGRHQWRRFFLVHKSMCLSFSLRPKLIPLSINQWNRPHAFGLRRCSCTPLVRIKLSFSGWVRTVPSPWQTQGHVSLTDDAYGRSAVGVFVRAGCVELGSVSLLDVPQHETSLEAAGAWPPPLTCDPQTSCQVCFGML